MLFNDDSTDMCGGRLGSVGEFLAIRLAPADHLFLLFLWDGRPLLEVVDVALGEDITAAGESRIFGANQGNRAALFALRILRAGDETGEVARIEVLKAVHLVLTSTVSPS